MHSPLSTLSFSIQFTYKYNILHSTYSANLCDSNVSPFVFVLSQIYLEFSMLAEGGLGDLARILRRNYGDSRRKRQKARPPPGRTRKRNFPPKRTTRALPAPYGIQRHSARGWGCRPNLVLFVLLCKTPTGAHYTIAFSPGRATHSTLARSALDRERERPTSGRGGQPAHSTTPHHSPLIKGASQVPAHTYNQVPHRPLPACPTCFIYYPLVS